MSNVYLDKMSVSNLFKQANEFTLSKEAKLRIARGVVLTLEAATLVAAIHTFYQLYLNPSQLNPWSEAAAKDWNIMWEKPSALIPFSAASYEFTPLYQASRVFGGMQIVKEIVKGCLFPPVKKTPTPPVTEISKPAVIS